MRTCVPSCAHPAVCSAGNAPLLEGLLSVSDEPYADLLELATWDSLTEHPDEYEQLTAQLMKGRRAPVTCYRMMMSEHIV